MTVSPRSVLRVIALLAAAVGLYWLARYEVYHAEIVSPDGRYLAVAHRRWIQGLLPAMPGQGSDASGSITIHDQCTGRALGRRPVAMVSFLVDLRWGASEAWIPAVARWPLGTSGASDCRQARGRTRADAAGVNSRAAASPKGRPDHETL